MLDNVLTQDIDVSTVVRKAGYPEEAQETIVNEGLLPVGLVNGLHRQYPQYSILARTTEAQIETELAESLADAMKNATNIRMDRTLQEDQSAEIDFPAAH